MPPEVVTIPKYGAVNLYSAPLPLYRGPNPLRGVYDGHPLLGATLHWIAPEYDTGNILAQATCPLPDDRSVESVFGAWSSTMSRPSSRASPAPSPMTRARRRTRPGELRRRVYRRKSAGSTGV